MVVPTARIRPPSPPLADELVSLRPLEPADAQAIFLICQDPEIARWTHIPQPYRVEHAQQFIEATTRAWAEGSDPTFAVIERRSGQLAGAIGLTGKGDRTWDVGYWVAPFARGRGVATSALRLISDWAFRELGAQRIGLHVFVGNDNSVRVAEKAGYQREGLLRRYTDQRGVLRDTIVHSLIAEDRG
jgi:RimJ/RimL family protein N-acetyltransferase